MKPLERLAPALLALGLGTASVAGAQGKGDWQGPFPLPLPGIHAVLLPLTGNVLLYSYPLGEAGSEVWVLDPNTLGLTEYSTPANIFCSGQGVRGNGQALIVGGTMPAPDPLGEEEAYTFREPDGLQQVQSMADGRWYPTVTKLKSGRMLVLSGLDGAGFLNPLVEIWNPNQGWQVVAGADKFLPLYPRAFLIPTGEVFVAGPHRTTEALETSTGSWRFIDRLSKEHYQGSAVQLTPGVVMVMGGTNYHGKRHLERVAPRGARTSKRVERIDLNDANPQWVTMTPMNRRRQHANSVQLPDGTVLVLGGERHKGVFVVNVKRPDLYDPATDTWTLQKAASRPRLYHSTALLLPDARVLTSGGDDELTGEIFSPPYLFRGRRPSLTGVPAEASYGSTFQVDSDQADQIASACLIAPGAVTHSFNQNQRFVPVTFAVTGVDQLTIDAPPDGTIAPPGHYLLYLVNGNGVPSMGKFVRIRK